MAALRGAGATVEEGWPEGVNPEAQFETYAYLLFQAMDGMQPEEVKATIRVARGQPYTVGPIADFGPHNTWMNRDGSRVYFEVLTERGRRRS